jgi:hypothetical protein
MKIILTESQYRKLIKEIGYPGTSKLLGADGVNDDVFNEILRVIPILFSADTTSTPLVNKVKSQGKVKNEDYLPIAQFINQIYTHCQKGDNFINFNNVEYPGFCNEINEILYSDSDNKFSHSYGITR